MQNSNSNIKTKKLRRGIVMQPTESLTNESLARRTLIKGAALGLAGGSLAAALPAQSASAAEGEIWSGEYWAKKGDVQIRSEEHTSELQSRQYLVCRLLLEKKK